MGMIEVTGGEGQGEWKPLPQGNYAIQIAAVEATTSKNGNPSLKVSGTVYDGALQGKKVVIWYSRLPTAAWKIARLLEAAIPGEYEKVDTGKKNDKGDPEYTFSFDTDDLVGTVVCYDVTVGTMPNGNAKNDFANEVPYETADSDDDDDDDDADADNEEAETPPAAAAAASETKEDKSDGKKRARRRRRTA